MPFKPSIDFRFRRAATTATTATNEGAQLKNVADVADVAEWLEQKTIGDAVAGGFCELPRRCGGCLSWRHKAGYAWWCGVCTVDGKAAGWKSRCRQTDTQRGCAN